MKITFLGGCVAEGTPEKCYRLLNELRKNGVLPKMDFIPHVKPPRIVKKNSHYKVSEYKPIKE